MRAGSANLRKSKVQIDLRKASRKVSTTESERVVDPKTTVDMAMEALARVNLRPEVTIWEHGGVFFTSRVDYRDEDLKLTVPLKGPVNDGRRPEGKGRTRDQAIASVLMELIERISLAQVVAREDRQFHLFKCTNVRTGETQMALLPQTNAGRCGAGNTYEECLLHGLHETIELVQPSTPFKPIRHVNIDRMFSHWPRELLSSVQVFSIPVDKEKFYRMIAVRYPIDGKFDPEFRVVNEGGVVTVRNFPAAAEQRTSAYGGSAAGLNPALVIERAVMETFQGPATPKDLYPGKRKAPPDWVESVDALELPNFETESVTGDIQLIMETLGEQAFVGAIDITSPDLKVPVLSVFAEYFPSMSLTSRKLMGMFFDLSGIPNI